ncbi:MAG: phosphoglucosamine mutase [Candidatus Pacebacteria bacterium]|nr:phosphoglucosamine mutase [Candidatus Paceibacterota bacterium]
MQNTLKLGISGIRGIWGKSLLPENTEQIIKIFLDVVKPKKVILGTDTRKSRNEISEIVIRVLREYGCTVIHCGITATPTLAFTVRTESADAGIMITASHNPAPWNGLKFFTPLGLFLDPSVMNQIIKQYESGENPLLDTTPGSVVKKDDAGKNHIDKILKHVQVDVIKNAKLTTVIDMGNGAGIDADAYMMAQLGIDAIYLHEKIEGEFERNPEPLPEFLDVLGQKVRETGAQVGFAQDPDADRLAIVDEKGNPIGEEYTLVLAMRHYLQTRTEKQGGPVVANLSTSKMFDDVANEFGCKIMRTQIGEIHVANAMVENQAVFGGEGNGGIIWPEIGYVRDSYVGIALILEMLAVTGKTLSELVAEIPKYEIVKDKIEVSSRQEVEMYLEKVKTIFSEFSIDETDGIKVNFDNGWLHVRASNTEPIVRFFAEAPTKEQAQDWIHKIL